MFTCALSPLLSVLSCHIESGCNKCGHQVPHSTYNAPSYPPSCDYFLGSLLDSTDVLYVVWTPQKAPEEVVADGCEGAIYVCSVAHDETTFLSVGAHLGSSTRFI
jgi:hypothetical protein